MKVLHILNELRPSGAEVMLRIAAPLWVQHGCECDILATSASPGPYAEVLAASGYRIHHLPRRRVAKPWFDAPHFIAVRRLVRREGYDIVHQHLEASGYWYAMASLSGGAAVVRTFHSYFPNRGLSRLLRALQRWHLGRLGVRFVAVAPGVQANEKHRFGLETELVLNWADRRFAAIPASAQRLKARARFGYDEADFVLVSLGNCSNIKNHGLVIEAMALCQDLHQLRYLHVGIEEDGAPEHELARRRGVLHMINFAGWIDDPVTALHAADAFIMPSRVEGLGMAAVEAMGTGLPALLADAPGLRDLDRYFPHIFYFAPNAAGAARAVREVALLTAPERADIGRTYPEVFLRYFTAVRGVAEYVSSYRAALAGTRAG